MKAPSSPFHSAFALATLLVLSVPAPARAQSWTVTSLEHIDLWYHGLAIIGFEGFALLPMYNSDYADRVRAAKEALGVYPTELDRMASAFRAGFGSDSTFEILHFLPLYFASSSRTAMLAALQRVTEGQRPAPGLEQFGASVATSVLSQERQRVLLGDFVRALEAEWTVFLRTDRAASRETVAPVLSETASYWNDHVAPGLVEYLRERGMEGGVIIASPALGGEGRVFQGSETNPYDNVVVVPFSEGASRESIVSHAVRESCFPVVSTAVAARGMAPDRVLAEQISSRGAVRCGAMLLDGFDPELAAAYRQTFMRYAPNVNAETTFETAFPVDRSLLADIANRIGDR